MTLNPQDELLERARKVIRELREKLSAVEARSQSEPIAIIGMGIRLPGCGSDQKKFWQMILEGRDAVRSVPPDRWDRDAFHASESPTPGKINTRRGAFLDDVRRFDAAFFDVTPHEATRMDPQQRIFLETAWHALEDAGLPKARIVGTDTGVFVGVHDHSADYSALQFEDLAKLDGYVLTGTAHDVIAGRLAYWLDLHGPAVAVNTACSSSLTAVHFAIRSLRAGDCTMAIVGGVNLLLTPGTTVAAAQLQLLSADGRCKTFDARADGMGRGEGCGVVVLKKLDDALRDGDRVLAVIRGSAVNQDGRTNGLTAPSGLAQQSLLRSAFKDAGVEPWEIGYVEAHGTGTALGDPIEVEALTAVLGGMRREQPCTLGAVKANIGHLEGAAGIAGLIKAVLVLRRRWLPPVAKLEKLNPHLALDGTGLRIPQHGCEWRTANRRLAGVSSFGFSGTNAHVVLEEAPAPTPADTMNREWPVLVSAQSPEALQILSIACADRLEHANGTELANISYTSAVRRTHHAYRIALMGSDPKEIAAQLRERVPNPFIEMKSGQVAKSGPHRSNERMRGWEDGAEVDWSTTFPAQASVVDLPLYPFQGKPYWLSETPASSATAASFPQEWLYSTEWVESPLDLSQADASVHAVTWLLVCAEKESGGKLAEAVRHRGHRVIEVRRGNRFARESEDEFVLGDDFAEGIKEVLAELTLDRVQPHRALYLAGGKDAAALTAEALELAKAVILCGTSLMLWFITQAAESIAQPAAAHHGHSALRGFSRVLGIEHPERGGGVIDLDSFCEENLGGVCEEVARESSEDRVALRHGSRWVVRLRRDRLTPEPERLKLRTDRCYLVTGAYGRLGMKIASWLVDCGARHLALVGRRNPSEMGDPGLMKELDAWREQGITVLAEACDVAQESQVHGLLSKIESTGRVLGGVVHAAAGFRFSPIMEASRQDVELALRAKVEGARVLDRCTRECQLDFFVLFGSAAATIGLRNGALYAAANSSLDAIRAQRQSEGLPVLLVDWGSWEGASSENQLELVEQELLQQELIGRSGFQAMQHGRALSALGALINAGRTTGMVADIDWAVLGPALEMRGRQALIEGLLGETTWVAKAADVPQETAWLDDLRDLPAQERRYRLMDFVREAVRQVFGMMPQDFLDEDRGLFQMGMDSLMAVELQNSLAGSLDMQLPPTLVLTYPTISALSRYLEEKLLTARVRSNGEPVTPVKPEKNKFFPGDQTVDQMNDSEIDAAIAAELAAIQQKLGVL
jgi:acyl transferase domain-containing protein/acyl carrier protein